MPSARAQICWRTTRTVNVMVSAWYVLDGYGRCLRRKTPVRIRRGALGGLAWIGSGGSCEIRTHGGVAPTRVFKTPALNHSATLPDFHADAAGVVAIAHAIPLKPIPCGALQRCSDRRNRPACHICGFGPRFSTQAKQSAGAKPA